MKKKREKRNERKTGIQTCSASIYFCIEGEQRIDDRESERERKRSREGEKDSTALQPTPRAHHHIIQFASISTRSSNSSSYNSSNEYE